MSQSAGQQRVWKQSPPPQQLIRHIAISPSPSPTLHATNLSVSHQQVSHQGGSQQQQPPPSASHSAQSLATHQLLSGGPNQVHSQQQHLARSSPNVQPGVHPGSHGTSVSSSASSSASVAVTSAHSVSQMQHQLQAVNAAHQREREREPAPNQSPAHQPSGHQVSSNIFSTLTPSCSCYLCHTFYFMPNCY